MPTILTSDDVESLDGFEIIQKGTFGPEYIRCGDIYRIDDEENPYRTGDYSGEITIDNFLNKDERELFLEETKLYIGEHKSLAEAISFMNNSEINKVEVFIVKSEKEAVELLQKSSEKHLFYIIKK